MFQLQNRIRALGKWTPKSALDNSDQARKIAGDVKALRAVEVISINHCASEALKMEILKTELDKLDGLVKALDLDS